jgi:hypothetical protein
MFCCQPLAVGIGNLISVVEALGGAWLFVIPASNRWSAIEYGLQKVAGTDSDSYKLVCGSTNVTTMAAIFDALAPHGNVAVRGCGALLAVASDGRARPQMARNVLRRRCSSDKHP